jgi:aerobic-type carbon monoxide dehydrogenase small subunit (CoxS/CutS family)
MDGKRVKSCLSLAALVEGREITTIEGLAQGDQLHPLQAAFIERDAFQCGYCTSGQIMAGVACINYRSTNIPVGKQRLRVLPEGGEGGVSRVTSWSIKMSQIEGLPLRY